MRQIRWGRITSFQGWLVFVPPRALIINGVRCWLHSDLTVAAYHHEGD